jgi:hypothetical protein
VLRSVTGISLGALSIQGNRHTEQKEFSHFLLCYPCKTPSLLFHEHATVKQQVCWLRISCQSLCFISLRSIAVNELARYCKSYASNTESFNSTANEVTVLFHSDDRSNSHDVSRGFSLRFNTSQNGELSMLCLFIGFPSAQVM